MSAVQHGHDGNWIICVNLLPTMVQVRVLLIYLGVLPIVTFPVISNPNRPSSATLKVSEIRDRQRDTNINYYIQKMNNSNNSKFGQTSF